MKNSAEQISLFPKRPYNQPGDPASYSEKPVPLSEADVFWMKDMNKRIWKPCAPDRFGHVIYTDDGSISVEEQDKIFRLIRECKLMTTMGCGMFGLSGYSMGVWNHPEFPGLGPEHLMTLTDGHLPAPSKEVMSRFNKGEERQAVCENAWILFSQFTHSPTNLKLIELYKSESRGSKIEPPQARSYYDY